MRELLKEPLVHFLVLGVLFFAGYELMSRREEPEAGRIVVTQGKIENLQASFSRVWQRQPTPSEMDGLIQDYIREEVLAREAMTLGLDRDDTVIRRRLRQKMEFIANDLAAPVEPTEAVLEEFLAKHPDLFRVEPRFSFRQVYLSAKQRGGWLQRDAAQLLAELNQPGATADFRTLGDATMLNPELADVPGSEVTRQFGEEFTRQLEELPTGRWHGPVISGYGVHLVFVEKQTPGRMPELADVREQVTREWADTRRREDNERFYQELLRRYAVTIEGESSGAHGVALATQVK
jgi:hypothetical protein